MSHLDAKYCKAIVIAITLILGACGHQPKKSTSFFGPLTKEEIEEAEKEESLDGPPEQDIDVTHIPNATPKIEPLSRYGNPSVYEVWGNRYRVMPHSKGYSAKGTASWYGKKFHGLRTSSGEPYDMFAMTAAHRSLPIPTYAKVKNLHNGKEVIVKINDRGPFVHDRLIDLSYAAAKKLGIHAKGTGKVQITAIDPVKWHKDLKAKETNLAKVNQAKKGKANTNAKASQLAQNKKPAGNQQQLAQTTKTLLSAKSSKPTTKSKKSSVAHKASTQKTTLVAAPSPDKKIFLQLGTFTHKANADKLANKASTLTQAMANVKTYSDKSTHKSAYKVQIGPLQDESQAQELKKKLLALNGAKPKLIYE